MTAMARKRPENAPLCGRSRRERLLVVLGMCTAALVSAGDPVFAQTTGYNLGVTTALDAQGVAADATEPGTKPAAGNGNFLTRLFKAYVDGFRGVEEEAGPEPPRRALPAPFDSPPFPSSEYQGYPLIGVPYSTSTYPLMEAIYGGPWGDAIKASRIKLYGWVNASGSFSNAENSNMPTSYWIFPNQVVLNQFVVRLEREVDSVQTSHIDWGFRSTLLVGTD